MSFHWDAATMQLFVLPWFEMIYHDLYLIRPRKRQLCGEMWGLGIPGIPVRASGDPK